MTVVRRTRATSGSTMTRSAIQEVREIVAEGLASAGDDHADRSDARVRARRLAEEALAERARRLRGDGSAPPMAEDADSIVDGVLDILFGLGGLQRLIEDASVENIDVNGFDEVWVTRSDGTKERAGQAAASDEELVAIVRAASARFGLSERRFDAAQPELDLRLPDGSRLSAVMAVTKRPVVDIRRHRLVDNTLDDLVALGSLSDEAAAFLAAAVRARQNILVSGAMNAGKTTMLRALAAEIPPGERIVTIEQALELGLDEQLERHPDCVAMEARLANTEGVGAIGVAQLVRRSLRMNASRVIVGEVLGDEVVPMLNAMSQGRSGSMATIHADSSAGVFRRLASYAVQAPERLPLEASNLLIAGSVHLVVHLESREAGGADRGARRYIASIREVVDADGPLVVSNEIWQPGPHGRAVIGSAPSERTIAALGRAGYEWTGYDRSEASIW
jgi:Flp pilus assembly CpaF family ATPase